MQRSDQINDLAAALVKAQGKIGGAKKDSTNPHFKSSYADLASVWDAVREPLSANGLAVVQWPRTVENGVEIETMIAHSSGQWMSDILWMPAAKMDAHGLGSAITYGRRYALMSVCGVAPVDDDANAAVAGMASGGGEFRPPGRRPSSWGDGGKPAAVAEAQKDGLTANPPAAKSAAEKNGNAVKRVEWVKASITLFKELDKQGLTDWWKENRERIDVIEGALPTEYERMLAAYDSAIENAARAA